VSEREALRHQFTDHDVEEREDEVGRRDRERGRHPGVEGLRQHVLAERTDTQ